MTPRNEQNPVTDEMVALAADAWRLNLWTYLPRITRGAWVPYRWLEYAARVIQRELLKGNARIIINAPARHGKSELFSYGLPTWFLDWFPEQRVILSAYESSVAADWGRKVRDTLSYSEDTWTRVKDDVHAANRWHTTEGGGMITAGVGGPIVGRGGNLLILEDPVKNWEQAHSSAYQEKLRGWFRSTFWTRREPGASVIVIMHRWAEDDLCGWIESEFPDKWTTLRFPAIWDDEVQDEFGPCPLGRKAGDALCPERYTAEELSAMKVDVGGDVWAAMYQQNPGAKSGVIFRNHWVNYWTSPALKAERPQSRGFRLLPEAFDEIIHSWDCTFKDLATSDWVVGQVWGRVDAYKFLLAQVRERMGFVETKAAVLRLLEQFPEYDAVLIEDKANGTAVVETLRPEVPGLIAVNPEGGKVARAWAVSPQWEAGQVFLPDPAMEGFSWVSPMVKRVLGFPGVKWDDEIDGMTQALNRFRNSGTIFIGKD